ncbi:metallophosphoesterase family protein [Cytobacillus praedii]|uniref:metallophosphoesterase family protein n=1 Tax=Cytobacillus praedii TaxID=1742358 RepID=UPI003F7FC1D4
MKIAVIADIHGNASAIMAVLDEIGKRQEIEHIYCLGNMIGIGPHTNEVLDILFSRNDISMISGNHDEAVLALIKGEEHPFSHSHAREHHQWIAERMDKSFISKLEQLPRTIKKEINGKSILFIHYHIEKGKLNEHISKDPFHSIVEPSLENLEVMFKGNNENLICYGHHHPTHYFKNDKTIYLNPGALGCNTKSTAPYEIVDVKRDKTGISLNEANYNNLEFLASYGLLQVPNLEFILKVFHGNQLRQ